MFILEKKKLYRKYENTYHSVTLYYHVTICRADDSKSSRMSLDELFDASNDEG